MTWGYGILYPLLISPAWAVFDDPSRAYVAAKVVNSVLLGVTAFPAYFLARKFVETRAAVAVAAFSVFVPSMLYSGTLLTEVALYPCSCSRSWASPRRSAGRHEESAFRGRGGCARV